MTEYEVQARATREKTARYRGEMRYDTGSPTDGAYLG